MKHSIIFAICVAVLVFVVPAASQVSVDKIGVKFTNFTYAGGEADTSLAQYMAGARSLSLFLTALDSVQLDVVVQYKTNGTWTTILTDSLCSTTAAGTEKEYSIKDGDSDLCDGIYYPLRVILTGQDDVLGTGVTTPTFTAKWIYRP